MQEPIVFRLLSHEDAAAFCALRLKACADEPGSFMETPEEVQIHIASDPQRYFKNGWIAAALVQNEMVGIAGIYGHEEQKLKHKGTLWGVYVLPDQRRKGIAKQLIDLVIKEAKAAGIERIHLSVVADHPHTIALYESMGFTAWGLEKHSAKLSMGYTDDVWMVKELTSR